MLIPAAHEFQNCTSCKISFSENPASDSRICKNCTILSRYQPVPIAYNSLIVSTVSGCLYCKVDHVRSSPNMPARFIANTDHVATPTKRCPAHEQLEATVAAMRLPPLVPIGRVRSPSPAVQSGPSWNALITQQVEAGYSAFITRTGATPQPAVPSEYDDSA